MSRNKKNTNNDATTSPLKREFKPKTRNQADYVRSMVENDIVFCIGPAGCGKTACAVGLAVEYLMNDKIKKIVITRPTVESGRGIGFLPGDMKDKVDPYIKPIYDELHTYLDPKYVAGLFEKGIIEIAPLAYMRGRTFYDTFVLLDEAQNADFKQMKMFVTRIGPRSKMVINGDTDQNDLGFEEPALMYYFEKLEGLEGIGLARLDDTDIIRHHLIGPILSRIEKGKR